MRFSHGDTKEDIRMQYTLYQWMMFFFLYCIAGWIFETTVVSISKRRFVNRGFMKGPFLPIYGCGAILILLLTLPFRHLPIVVFLLGMAGATLLEYITGLLMETLFKVRYWDYSHKRFNFQGRICLTSSLVWGAFSILLNLFIQPALEGLVFKMNAELVPPIVFTLSVIFLYDFSTSFRSAINLRKLLEQNERLRAEAEALQARLASVEGYATQVKTNITDRIGGLKDATSEALSGFSTRIEKLQNVPDDLRKELVQRSDALSTHVSQLRAKLAEGIDLKKLLGRNPGATSVNYKQAFLDTLNEYRSVDERKLEEAEVSANRFAQGINFYKLFWIFFIGSFAGVIIETLFCLLSNGYYENRVGVLWGPFSPLYGVGAVVLTVGLYFLRFHRDMHILFMGAVLGSIVEYVGSWGMETFFHTKAWDYSHYQFNINGRICLVFSIFWGILAVYWIKDIFPRINYWIFKSIPDRIGKALTLVLCLLMCLNIGMTQLAQIRWSNRIQGLPAQNVLDEFFDNRFGNERMQKIFANTTFDHADTPTKTPDTSDTVNQ